MVTQNPRDDRPPRVEEMDMSSEPPIESGGKPAGRGLKLGGGLMQNVLISLIISIVVLVGVNSLGLMFVSKSDFTKNLSAVSTTISAIDAKLASATKASTEIPTTIDTAMKKATSSYDTKFLTYEKQMSDLNKSFTTLSTQVGGYDAKITDAINKATAASTKVDGIVTKVDTTATSVTTLTTKVDANSKDATDKLAIINAKLTNYEARIKAVEDHVALPTPTPTATVTPTPTTTTTPTPTITPGQVVASFFNSPMIFSKPLTTQNKSFGIKLVNSYTDKDLVSINLTIRATITNLDAFEANALPLLESAGGIFAWNYERGLGNIAIFTADAFLYVPRNNGEFSDTQKLTLTGNSTMTGTYTVTINSVTINSKSMQ